MDNEMIDRLANAILTEVYQNSRVRISRGAAQAAARAGWDAIKEPSLQMLEAGAAAGETDHADGGFGTELIALIWRAMVGEVRK
jgi:hypothetical protein